jgi:hypothetical protein
MGRVACGGPLAMHGDSEGAVTPKPKMRIRSSRLTLTIDSIHVPAMHPSPPALAASGRQFDAFHPAAAGGAAAIEPRARIMHRASASHPALTHLQSLESTHLHQNRQPRQAPPPAGRLCPGVPIRSIERPARVFEGPEDGPLAYPPQDPKP